MKNKIESNQNESLNRLFPIFINNLESFIIFIDNDRKIALWNKASENCFGIPEGFTKGKKLTELPLIWDKYSIEEHIINSQSNYKSVQTTELEIERPDNKKKWISIKIYRTNIPEENISGFFIIGTDITEQKMSFDHLKEDNKFKAIGELSAGIAHEINSPLQYIHNNLTFINDVFSSCSDLKKNIFSLSSADNNYQASVLNKNILELLNNTNYDELLTETKEAIEQSFEGVKRIEIIVNSLKNYAHPEMDAPIKVFLKTIIQDSINLSINEWKYVADIETVFPDDDIETTGYPTYLSQVFVNMLINAGHAIEELISVKKIKRGKIKINLESEKEYVNITISDNGIGMSDKVKSRIFEPFFTTKKIGKGTGQGLAIVYSIIVNKHNGQIFCESKIGEGTKFIIKLPVSTA